MEIGEWVRAEWEERHTLGPATCAWLRAHADAGDVHPIATAVELLRAMLAAAE